MADNDVALPGVTNFRSELDPVVQKEFDHHNAALNGFLTQEHQDNGSHGHITALSSLIVSNDDFLSFYRQLANGDLRLIGKITQEKVGTSDALLIDGGNSAQIGITVHQVDAMRFGVRATNDTGTEQQVSDALSVLKRLKLYGQGSTSADPPGTDLCDDGVDGPLYSVYAVTSTGNRTVSGITTSNTIEGARGQILITWNDDATNVLTFAHNSTATSYRRLFCPHGVDLKVGPGGVVVWRYDVVALRWRCLSVSGRVSSAYTPTWTSTGTQPAIVDGTIAGQFQRDGSRVDFQVSQTIGASDTFGTGNYNWSVPVSSQAVGQPIAATAFDSSTGKVYVGMATYTDATHLVVVTADPAGVTTFWGPTVPFTWASGDVLALNGAYFV